MEKFNLAWISEVLLIFGSVNLGVAFSTLGASSPVSATPLLIGTATVFISVILKYKAGIYKG